MRLLLPPPPALLRRRLATVAALSISTTGSGSATTVGTWPSDNSSAGPPCSSVGVTCGVGRGEIQDSALALTEVVWIGPESRGVYVGSPSIVQLRNGTALASHDFFGSRGTLNATVQVLRDDSGHVSGPGSRWVYAGNVSGIYWANLFLRGVGASATDTEEEVFLMGASFGDAQVGSYGRSIVISRSVNAGRSWTKPAVIFAGGKLGTPGYESYGCAPTPTILGSDGRLYRNFGGRQGINIVMTKRPVTDRQPTCSMPTRGKPTRGKPRRLSGLWPIGWFHLTGARQSFAIAAVIQRAWVLRVVLPLDAVATASP